MQHLTRFCVALGLFHNLIALIANSGFAPELGHFLDFAPTKKDGYLMDGCFKKQDSCSRVDRLRCVDSVFVGGTKARLPDHTNPDYFPGREKGPLRGACIA